MYSSKSSNPFLDDEDDQRPSNASSGYGYRAESGTPMGDRRAQLKMQMDESEDRQVASTQRALASIYDSERMGIATAEELLHQGEQLDNIERKNDEMSTMMTTSQKHLNNIKSVFGGIKNWWSGGKKEQQPSNQSSKANNLRETVEKERDSGVHPALRLKSEDGRGFYSEDDLDDKFMAGARQPPPSHTHNGPMFKPLTRSDKEQQMENNLGEMSDGISRLKSLAMGLGDEIESQNDQLDRIAPKVGRNQDLLENQNAQMRKILHK